MISFHTGEVFTDFFPNNKKRVMIITKTNLEIKFALLLKIVEAQSKRGKSLREFLIVSLSISILNSFSLDIAKSIKLIHRRDEFRGAPNTEAQMRELVKEGKIELKTPYVIESLIGEDQISGVELKNFETKEIEEIHCDELLFLFGLNKKLGPISEWGIDMNNKKISVDTEKFETSTKGIFAVGDINDYPGKLDLILCGFHETTLAVQEAYRRSNPGERVPFGYTTSNTKLQKKLGVTD